MGRLRRFAASASQARVRERRLVLTLALAALCLPFAARVLAGPRGAEIHVRWQPSVDEAARRTLEARFALADGERLDGQTWRYDLTNPDPDNIRAIITDATVADTHDLDRSTYSLTPSAALTDRRQRFGNAGPVIVRIADLLALGLLALAAVVLALPSLKRHAPGARRMVLAPLLAGSRSAAPTPSNACSAKSALPTQIGRAHV